MEAPVPDDPSPKFQVAEYGAVPPVVIAVNVTGVFTIEFAGWNVKPVDRGIGPTLRFTWYQFTSSSWN
jgi:hypothetical protein